MSYSSSSLGGACCAPCASSSATLGADADWWIENTAAVISNKRREGWSDAKITAWLQTEPGRTATSILGGPSQTVIAAAFAKLSSPTPAKASTARGSDPENAILYGVPVASFYFLTQKYPSMSVWHRAVISGMLGVLGKTAFQRIK